jgi:hypothetical protein
MPLYFRGNYLLAGRIGYGVLSEENHTLGLSAGIGRTLDTMGYDVRETEPKAMGLVGADAALLHDGFEHRFDLFGGKWLGLDTVALMYRLGYLFGPEERLKIELQPTYWRSGGENWLLSACFSAQASADLTLRTMYEYDRDADDHRVILQLYYYKRL